MEKEKIKEFIKKHKLELTIGAVGLSIAIGAVLRIRHLEKELNICQGEKLNLETSNHGMMKTIENLVYQTGKLAGKRKGGENYER